MAVRTSRAVGRNVLRKEGVEKVTGAAQYIDDLPFADLLHARTIRSTIPAGEIVNVRLNFDKAGFTIVDHRDIPGRNIVALIDDDQQCLASRAIRHVAEPILLLAHEDRDRLLAADVQIECRETTPNYDAAASAVTFKSIAIDKGDLAAGFAAADVIVEGEYRVGHQEQPYIELQWRGRVPGSDGGITVRFDAVSLLRIGR
jgi:xanthine dehydrogenase molybdopterin-binding subunit B